MCGGNDALAPAYTQSPGRECARRMMQATLRQYQKARRRLLMCVMGLADAAYVTGHDQEGAVVERRPADASAVWR